MLTAALLALCPTPSALQEPEVRSIVILGDSYCLSEPAGDARLQLHAQLSERLNADRSYDRVQVRSLPQRYLELAWRFAPDVFVLTFSRASGDGKAQGTLTWDAELLSQVHTQLSETRPAAKLWTLSLGPAADPELETQLATFAEQHPQVTHLPVGELRNNEWTAGDDGPSLSPFGAFRLADTLHRRLADAAIAHLPASMIPTPAAEFRGGAGWNGETWWGALEHLKEQADAARFTPIVFFGDSITQGLTGHGSRVAGADGSRAIDRAFGDLGAISLGLSGDRTEHLLFRMRKGALPRLDPQVIVLQIGINNLNAAGHSAGETAAGIRKVVGELCERHPLARILVCGPFPAGRTADSPLRQSVDEVHRLIADIGHHSHRAHFGWLPQVEYLDLRGLFLNEDGSPNDGMAGDALHINGKGQAAWMEAIQPRVRAIVETPLVPELPAALAWQVENDNYPVVSRRLMRLQVGAAGPQRLVPHSLYSFDAADHTEVRGGLQDRWYFTGPVVPWRSAPNVGEQLNRVDGQGHPYPLQPIAPYFDVEAGSERIVTAKLGEVCIIEPKANEARVLLDADDLGQTMPRSVHWLPSGKILLDLGPVAGGTAGKMSAGRWLIAPDDGSFERIGDSQGRIRAILADGRLLTTSFAKRGESSTLAVETAAGEHRSVVVKEVHADSEVAVMHDGSVVYVDAQGRAAQLPGPASDEATRSRLRYPHILLEAEHGIGEIRACADWVAITRRETGRRSMLHLICLSTGQHLPLGPGQLPAWAMRETLR